MATSFTPPVYDYSDKTLTNRFLKSTSKIYNIGALSIVDNPGTLTAAQITEALNQWVNSRSGLPAALTVVEVTATTV